LSNNGTGTDIPQKLNQRCNDEILFQNSPKIKAMDGNSVSPEQVFSGMMKNINTEAEVNGKHQHDAIIQNTIKDPSFWFSKLTNGFFNKSSSEISAQAKFKNWKLKVDHTIEYEASSLRDVLAESVLLDNRKEELIFQQKLKNSHFEVVYKSRQNFKVNKQEIKDKQERELMKKYRDVSEKQATELIKEAFSIWLCIKFAYFEN
jgi:hypothetical protein